MSKQKSEKPAFEDGQIFSEQMIGMTDIERRRYLEDVAYATDHNCNYSKKLTEADLTEKRRELAEVSISINQVEIEKKDANDIFKAKLKPLDTMKAELLTSIRSKQEFRKGDVYLIDDQEAGLMYTFDSDGYCVGSRPLARNERQLSIHSKTAVNE